MDSAAAESGASVSTASMLTHEPSGAPRGASTADTPGTVRAATTTASAAPGRARIVAGADAPAGKCRSSRCWPVSEPTSLVNMSLWVMPVFSVNAPAATASSASAVPTQTRRGRRPTPRASRAQTPWSAATSAAVDSAKRGTNGQNSHRPHTTSSAGRSVSIATSAVAMPIAPTGPSPRVEFMSAASRHMRLIATVAPDARMAGAEARSAIHMASCRSAWRRSSSRYRAMSSSA